VASGLDIDGTDIHLAKSKLEHLRSLSAAEVAAQEARKQLMETKLRAYRLVKQGKAAALKELLQDASVAGVWPQWRDHSGRSLLVYARQVKAKTVQDCLEHLLWLAEPQARISPRSSPRSSLATPRFSPCHVQAEAATSPERQVTTPETVSGPKCPARVTSPETTSGPKNLSRVTTPNVAPWLPDGIRSSAVSGCAGTDASPCSVASKDTPRASPDEADSETALRLQAFRAVVKDDTKELNSILNNLSQDVWSSWQNKAGKDLLTLAQERRATGSYALIGRALGLLQERKREAFEECETVWVLCPGEVQARHGTVVEDAPADGDTELLIEFWDRPGPPQKVDRANVLKAM